jgi:hypothetical protein
MIRDSDPDPDFLAVPNPGSRGQKGTESRIRIRNIGIPPVYGTWYIAVKYRHFFFKTQIKYRYEKHT